MAASEVGRASARPSSGNAPLGGLKSALLLVVFAGAFIWFFPLFHLVPLSRPSTSAAFDPVSAAAKIWKTDLPGAALHALELKSLGGPLRENPAAAAKKFAKSAGLGTAYYFVRGSGRVVGRDRNYVQVALDGAESVVVALRIGPIFGNIVRDGCGFLDVNAFPGLQEFNALSAELNALVEKNVLPLLREQANLGAMVQFAGCAEAPDEPPAGPLLTLVPVSANVLK